jgi:3-oxoadipate enol-lactonase
MPYADMGAQRLYYEDSGGQGRAVVFAHGFLMDHEMWRPQVEALRDEFRCIAYDARGWGQTETDGKPFDYWDLADDVVALLDHLRIDRTALVGISQGGFVGMRLALRYPDRVSGLVLADTDPHAFAPEVVELYGALLDQAIHTGVDDTMADLLTSILFAPGFDATHWVGKWRARPVAEATAAERCLVSRDDISHRLGEIRCPVLVVHGELDGTFPIDAIAEWVGGFARPATVVRVAGAGHSSTFERPDDVNPALRSFLHALP